MATAAQFQAAVDRLNAGTSKAGTVINQLKEKLSAALTNAGILGPEEEAHLAKLGEVATALEAMGADVADPDPIPVPDPDPTPEV